MSANMSMQGLQFPALEEDGRQIVVQSAATQGWQAYFTGAGDQLDPLSRGGGGRLRLSFTTPDTKSIEVSFAEPVEVRDGHADVVPAASWGLDDTVDAYVRMVATPVTAGNGAGNANAIDVGGGAQIYVPAPGDDGDTTIDLTTAVPVSNRKKLGYWNSDYETGQITPVADPGAPDGDCDLYNFEVKAFLLRKVQLGNTLGIVDIDPEKAQWLHQNHLLGLEVTKASTGVGEFGAWILLARQQLTES